MSTDVLYIDAPAKINLYLRVVGRRLDGYHVLATLMQKLALFDRLEIKKITGPSCVECPDSALPVDEDNIVLRAAQVFFSRAQERLPDACGVRIVLRKRIPIAAGLGGGSSDAAAVLVALNQISQTQCSRQELAELGVQLGADVPFFIYDWPVAWATGIGERLACAVGLLEGTIVLVNPGFPVATKWVYENLPLTLEGKKINLLNSQSDYNDSVADNPFELSCFKNCDVCNDLEQVTERAYTKITSIKSQLLSGGADSVLMSGSGPTVFGIFSANKSEQAQQCVQQMLQQYKQTFLVAPLHEELDRFCS